MRRTDEGLTGTPNAIHAPTYPTLDQRLTVASLDVQSRGFMDRIPWTSTPFLRMVEEEEALIKHA